MNQAKNPESEHEWPDDIEVSDRGLNARDRCHNEFSDLLRNEAIINMRRRQSQSLDESDYKAANAHLLAGQKKHWVRNLISSIALFLAGVPVALSITFVNSNPKITPDWVSAILFGSGILIAALSCLFQHFPR